MRSLYVLKFIFLMTVFFKSPAAGASGSVKSEEKTVPGVAKATLTFNLKFTYNNFPFKIRIFDALDPRKLVSGKFHNVKDLAGAPIGNEYKNGEIQVARGDSRKFVLVIENTEDKPLHFYVAPHSTDPMQSALNHKFFCLCTGQIYFVKPKSVWYKVVTMNVEDTADIETITQVHKVIGVDPLRMKKNLDDEDNAQGKSTKQQ